MTATAAGTGTQRCTLVNIGHVVKVQLQAAQNPMHHVVLRPLGGGDYRY